MVAKLDRLSRSMLDFTALMAKAQKQSWALVALDCAVDTSTPMGEAMANMLATFAQFERRLILQRTKSESYLAERTPRFIAAARSGSTISGRVTRERVLDPGRDDVLERHQSATQRARRCGTYSRCRPT